MKILNLKEECTACGACASVCPKNCVQLTTDAEGFYFPEIDEAKCVGCGKCESVCHCLHHREPETFKASYYGFSTDADILGTSTSGGVFASLAREILSWGGSVWGAAFRGETLRPEHTSTDSTALTELQKSKYIESYMGKTIFEIQSEINRGRRVLFCGTPCEVAGVKHAIKDEGKLLVTVDFICHGVPSSVLFQEHLRKLLKGEKLVSLDFRPKDKGWNNKSIRVITASKTRITPYYLDPFYKGFMTENAILRRSCYHCKFRTNHFSDITIADFWGYRACDPAMNTENGVSLIVANNKTGNDLVNRLDHFELHPIDNRYSDYAYAEKDYSKGRHLRDRFYTEYAKSGFEKAAKKTYMQGYHTQKAKYIIKKILGKV